VVFGSLSTVDRFRTAEAEALSRYNTVRSYVIETPIYLPGGRKIRAADILRTDLTHQPLIFLASCETASPEPNLPDQTFGFAAFFRLAGASAVSAPMFAVTWLAANFGGSAVLPRNDRWRRAPYRPARAQHWLAKASPADMRAFLSDTIAALKEGATLNGRPTRRRRSNRRAS